MNVSLDEHRLGGLRWIVVRGPDRTAFQGLGEHMRDEMAALTKNWGLVARLREHVKEPPGRATGRPAISSVGDCKPRSGPSTRPLTTSRSIPRPAGSPTRSATRPGGSSTWRPWPGTTRP
jgi:hypothetical protein